MVEIAPMTEEYIHVHCLHHGPVDPEALPADPPASGPQVELPPHPWSDADIVQVIEATGEQISHGWRGRPAREFMREMIRRYGTCAMLAWEDGKIVGQLRFYPRTIVDLLETAGAYGPVPWKSEEPQETLHVHCIMTSTPYEDEAEGRASGARRGTGQGLVQALVTWARAHDWSLIETQAHPDLDFLYGHEQCAGRRFWTKAGFRSAGTWHKALSAYPPRVQDILQREMTAKHMSLDEVETWHHMVRRM